MLKRFIVFVLIMTISTLVTVYGQTTINEPLFEVSLGSQIRDAVWHPSGDVIAVATDSGVKIYSDALQLLEEVNEWSTPSLVE
ncbi:MAG: hypothetical protein SF029_07490 [bacterium]|nr:hypothetical protein [bacterium]